MSAYAREREAKKFVDCVLDSTFWKEVATIVQLTEPLVRVLRLVDSDERPAMGYLYEAIHKAREEMRRRSQRRKKRADSYIEVLDNRWDTQLHKDLHAAGYWLNPCFQYDIDDMEKRSHTISGLIEVIEKCAHGNPGLRAKLIKLFRNAEGDIGHVSARCDRNILAPDEWWEYYGSSAPNLQKLAIRVLSQNCNASRCERNRSMFEHIHATKRNRLEHQRLNDLVYVHYNLRLQQRNRLNGRNYDPIDFEDFSSNGDWVLEDEPPTLTPDEVEAFHHRMASCTIQANDNDEAALNLDEIEDDDSDDDKNGGGDGRNYGSTNQAGRDLSNAIFYNPFTE